VIREHAMALLAALPVYVFGFLLLYIVLFRT
jgi:hypothetical protein